jgi:hypothetical protein
MLTVFSPPPNSGCSQLGTGMLLSQLILERGVNPRANKRLTFQATGRRQKCWHYRPLSGRRDSKPHRNGMPDHWFQRLSLRIPLLLPALTFYRGLGAKGMDSIVIISICILSSILPGEFLAYLLHRLLNKG